MLAKIGFWAFILGLALAIVFGIISPNNPTIIVILVILGVIIGLLNISAKEMTPLLLATIALIVVGGVFEPIKTMGVGSLLDNILRLLATLMAPAAVIAAVKTLVAIGFPKDKE
jgi:hypothetical protein